MRAIILLSAIIIGQAINPIQEIKPNNVKFIAIVWTIAAIFDIYEFFKRK